ncbi:7tm 6 domain containing protein, partial [Asbolus verrucosus]
MAVEDYDHFQFALKCYDISGLKRTCAFYKKFISVYVLYPLLLVLYTLMIINIRHQKNVFEIAAVFESVSTFGYVNSQLLFSCFKRLSFQLVARKTILLTHASLFEEISEDRSRFWHYDLYGKTAGDKFRNQMALCVSLFKFIWMSAAVSIIFRCCTPLFVPEYVLPDACYIPGESIYTVVIIFVLEVIFYLEMTFLFGVFDAFFVLMCVDLKVQFKLLNKTLRTINVGVDKEKNHEESCWRKLKKCFAHHRFLLSVHKKLNKAFSEFFVCMYFFTIGGMCIQLFIVLDGSANITHLIRIAMHAEKLIFEIYSIDWYNTGSLRIRKFILFWLIKAQIPLLMTGAEVLPVNRSMLPQ